MKIFHRSLFTLALVSTSIAAFANYSELDVNAKILKKAKSEVTFYQPDNSDISYSVIGGKAIIEGDIVVGDHDEVQHTGVPNLDIRDINTTRSSGDIFLPNAAWSGNTTWANSTVPYVISSASQNDRTAILAGMNLISSRTGVKFVQRTNQSDYIDIIKGSGCWSHVGRRGGRQELSIGAGCAYAGIVAHEFIHALGFYHEQSRYDRDNYVRINLQNITAGTEHNFSKHGAVTASIGGYDYRSIMHYTYLSFSSNGRPTIESLNASVPSNQLGQRQQLTDLDAAALNAVYGGGTTPVGEPLTVYEHCDFGGWAVKIPSGNQTLSKLQTYGFQNDKMSSFRIEPGYAVQFYLHDNYTGASHTATASDGCLADNGFNDNVSSLRVIPNGDPALDGTYALRNRKSGLYMDLADWSTANGANLLQWHFHGGSNQQFKFEHLGNGVYVIRSVVSGKALDISGISTQDGANLFQWEYLGSDNQKFIAHKVGNYYQLIPTHSRKVLDIDGGRTDADANIQQGANKNQESSHWELIKM